MSGIGDDHTDHRAGRARSRRCAGAASSATSSAAPPSSPRPTSPWPARPSARGAVGCAGRRALRPRGPADRRRRPDLALITVTMNPDGTASFALPRMEVGQGITTSTAMIIAEELDLPVERVRVTLAPARPELVMNQLTGGSNTSVSTYTPIRVAAAIARGALLAAAGAELGYAVDRLTQQAGGRHRSRRQLPARTPSSRPPAASAVDAGSRSSSRTAPTSRSSARRGNRVDALHTVTGASSSPWTSTCPRRCRRWSAGRPTLNGSPQSLDNAAAVLAMPGVTDVALVETGVAVRAETFGQCIDAIRASSVTWNRGTVEGESDATMLARLRKAELPLAVPKVPLLAQDGRAELHVHVPQQRGPRAELRDRRRARRPGHDLGRPEVADRRPAGHREGARPAAGRVRVNVVTGGGSFGHKLFSDAAIEAAKISQAMGAGAADVAPRRRAPPGPACTRWCTSRVRATHLAGQVLSFEQRQTSVVTDFSHGLGEMLTSTAAELPAGWATGPVAVDLRPHPGAPLQLRGRHPAAQRDRRAVQHRQHAQHLLPGRRACASELVIDQLAARMGKDPLAFRLEFLKSEQVRAVLRKVAEEGEWGRPMPPGTAQGIAVHSEYKGATAVPGGDRLPPRDGRPHGPRGGHGTPGDQGGDGGRRRAGDQPARPGGPDDRRLLRRPRADAHQQLPPAGRALPRGQLGQLLLHPPVERPAGARGAHRATPTPTTPAAPARPAWPPRPRPSPAPTPGRPARCRRSFPINHGDRRRSSPRPSCPRCRSRPTDGLQHTY